MAKSSHTPSGASSARAGEINRTVAGRARAAGSQEGAGREGGRGSGWALPGEDHVGGDWGGPRAHDGAAQGARGERRGGGPAQASRARGLRGPGAGPRLGGRPDFGRGRPRPTPRPRPRRLLGPRPPPLPHLPAVDLILGVHIHPALHQFLHLPNVPQGRGLPQPLLLLLLL